MRGKFNELKFEDIDYLRTHVDEISDISPLLFINAPSVRFGSTETSARVLQPPRLTKMRNNAFATMGRFLSESDETSASRRGNRS